MTIVFFFFCLLYLEPFVHNFYLLWNETVNVLELKCIYIQTAVSNTSQFPFDLYTAVVEVVVTFDKEKSGLTRYLQALCVSEAGS